MNWVFFLLVPLMPATAQERQDFTKQNDKQAITFYKEALNDQSNPGLSLKSQKKVRACSLIVNYQQMDWLLSYSAKHQPRLETLGIRTESVNILKIGVAKKLVQNLAERIKNNQPLKQMCMFCICSGGMCSTSGIGLSKIYHMVDFLDAVVKQVPSAGDQAGINTFREAWKKSVVQDFGQLTTKCQNDMRTEDWQQYSEECKTLIQALSYGVEPSALKLSNFLVSKLRAAGKQVTPP